MVKNRDLLGIPGQLWQEFGKALCFQEDEERYTRLKNYKVRPLEPNHKLVGFPGALGFQESVGSPGYRHEGFAELVLWDRVPYGAEEGYFHVGDPAPLLKISTTFWPYGVWQLKEADEVLLQIEIKTEFTAGDRATDLALMIAGRAQELAKQINKEDSSDDEPPIKPLEA